MDNTSSVIKETLTPGNLPAAMTIPENPAKATRARIPGLDKISADSTRLFDRHPTL
jgi:hypothetical protein